MKCKKLNASILVILLSAVLLMTCSKKMENLVKPASTIVSNKKEIPAETPEKKKENELKQQEEMKRNQNDSYKDITENNPVRNELKTIQKKSRQVFPAPEEKYSEISHERKSFDLAKMVQTIIFITAAFVLGIQILSYRK